jgi:hypothetical protein
MDQGTRTRPATAVDFHRLADVAHQRGLRLFRDGGRWYCSSASNAGGCHYVTGLSCDCQGFLAHQRCTHHALLLGRLGWIPEVEESTVAFATAGQENGRTDAESSLVSVAFATTDCSACCGCGVVTYRTFEERCTTCGGSGIKPDHRLHDAPAAPMVAAA